MASLVLAFLCLVVAGFGGFLWYKQRQQRNLIVVTGCSLVFAPFITLLAIIGAIVLLMNFGLFL